MMFEARVRTVDATECLVRTEDRRSSPLSTSNSCFVVLWSSSSAHTGMLCGRLRVLMQNLHTRYVTAAMTASPPMTPPAIAPTFGDEPATGAGVFVGFGAQVELAHCWQLVGYTNWHCVPAGQDDGHCRVDVGGQTRQLSLGELLARGNRGTASKSDSSMLCGRLQRRASGALSSSRRVRDFDRGR
jgi:hypothetical protein